MLNTINDYSIDKSYEVSFIEGPEGISIKLPSDIVSLPVEQSALESLLFEKHSINNDYSLRELWPSEFNFDFYLTIEAWKDLILCERRAPFETDGLTKQEAEWAWILVNQWETTPVDNKGDFLDIYGEVQETFEALGWDLYLDENSKEKLLDLFSFKTPLLVNYKPSKPIMDFYSNIWKPLKNNLTNT